MASITSTGLGSGLDVESIVTKLVSLEKQPITDLQSRTDTIKTQISEYGKIKSAFSAMRDAAAKLSNPSTWAALTATSSDTTMATVIAGAGSGAGSYTLSVANLASPQSLASKAFATNATVGSGSMTIELGQWSADNSTFTGKSGTSPVSVSISATDTLSSIRDKINGSGAGVLASVVTDASGQRLVIRSRDTGEANGFRITTADDDGNGSDASGLSALAYDPTSSVTSMTQNTAARNANLTVNGLSISSASNNIEGAVDGLTINLLKGGTVDGAGNVTPAVSTITVGQDKDSVKKAINDFVTSYNSLMTLMRTDTKYDDANKTAGALQGDSTAVGLQSQLRNITASGSTLGGQFGRLSDLGLDIGADGTMKVNDTKLTSALGSMADLKNLFMGVDNANPNNNGIATRWRAFADQVTGFDGSITTRTTGLQSRVTANGKRIDELNDRADAYEKRIRAQYTALDTQMAKLNDMQSYVNKITSMLGSS
ncbi:flagellar filament capping protein FliD [Mitsuaria sp. GD03876]|uniref:flagellar filament capping protein FliD n=1 Tax=Mitsuaria sp. GD03876 TaxID=2975399 RepID=UPI00244BA0C8|nr:flagellar filament capping protein FliD [Mitsuaria sp. GD03876]MDH0865128.1 flagellar filament capping protein FliD [Mitsuaria sp. GD03876]